MKRSRLQIDICIATYKRPALLGPLLHSLALQRLESGITARIIVVDNDREGSARHVVEQFSKSAPFEVFYDVEPEQGISFARNRTLRHVRADYFAFIDDDETVPADWLQIMFKALLRYDADVVFGPVVRILPPDAPKWAKNHPCFLRTNRATGSVMKHGATGNVLVRTKALGTPRQEFDVAYALTGGEDTEYFYRLYLAGKKLVWCDEAAVKEHVPANRVTMRWVCRRAFRGGQCFYRTFVRRYSAGRKCIWLITKPLQLVGGVLALPLVRVFSLEMYARLALRVCSALGQLIGVLGESVYFKEYSPTRLAVRSREG